MKLDEFKNVFMEYSDFDITEEQYKELLYYMQELLNWNNKINITAITNEKEFIIKHFIDSLTIDKYIKNYETVIDIGTGAGFPGIPLKILNKDKKFTLIDSVGKKLKVIESINNNLKLDNIEIIHSRAEELAHNSKYREKYDVAVTRAVSNMATICEYMLPFIRVDGIAICMKGPKYQEELNDAENAIKTLGGKIESIENLKINNEIERNIIIIKKIKKTENNYPRGQGKPSKEPIK